MLTDFKIFTRSRSVRRKPVHRHQFDLHYHTPWSGVFNEKLTFVYLAKKLINS